MDDNQITNILRTFDQVWQRIGVPDRFGPPPTRPSPTGPPERPHRQAEKELYHFLKSESELSGIYARLLRQMPNNHQFRRLKAETEDAVRNLQTEAFLLTGDSFRVPPSAPNRGNAAGKQGALTLLRSAFRKETALASEYSSVPPGPLTPLYRKLSQQSENHAETLRFILRRAMG